MLSDTIALTLYELTLIGGFEHQIFIAMDFTWYADTKGVHLIARGISG